MKYSRLIREKVWENSRNEFYFFVNFFFFQVMYIQYTPILFYMEV